MNRLYFPVGLDSNFGVKLDYSNLAKAYSTVSAYDSSFRLDLLNSIRSHSFVWSAIAIGRPPSLSLA